MTCSCAQEFKTLPSQQYLSSHRSVNGYQQTITITWRGGGGGGEMSLKAHKLALPHVYLRFSTVSSAVVLTIHSMTGEG